MLRDRVDLGRRLDDWSLLRLRLQAIVPKHDLPAFRKLPNTTIGHE